MRPLVDDSQPKPFLALFSEKPLLVQTAMRFRDSCFEPPIITCAANHFDQTVAVLNQHGIDYAHILTEPACRDTCMAIAAVVAFCAKRHPDAHLFITPVDHYIPDFSPFVEAMKDGIVSGLEGSLLTFGIPPTRPEPSYGHIKPSATARRAPVQVSGFQEKPATAPHHSGHPSGVLWNSGMFFATVAAFESEFHGHCKTALAIAHGSLNRQLEPSKHVHLERYPWSCAKFGSFDQEIMQKTRKAQVIEIKTEWQDLGNWHTVSATAAQNPSGQHRIGAAKMKSVSGSFLVAQNAEITLRGVKDLLVVAHNNKVLVAPNRPTQGDHHRLSDLPQSLDQATAPPQLPAPFLKPWGHYTILATGPGYVAKRLELSPHSATSLQKHAHRSEHWVVVEGVADIVAGDRHQSLKVGQSAAIETGQVHRISNNTNTPLVIVETQIGRRCDEEDIVRVEDRYGRA